MGETAVGGGGGGGGGTSIVGTAERTVPDDEQMFVTTGLSVQDLGEDSIQHTVSITSESGFTHEKTFEGNNPSVKSFMAYDGGGSEYIVGLKNQGGVSVDLRVVIYRVKSSNNDTTLPSTVTGGEPVQ
jgi:hypothetical protein